MKNVWKRYRVFFVAAAMVICLTAGFGLGMAWTHSAGEKQVVKEAAEELQAEAQEDEETAEVEPDFTNDGKDLLVKDIEEDPELVQQVCDKYELDPETALLSELGIEGINYLDSLRLQQDMGDLPLLGDYGMGITSLEVYLNEVFAFDGGEAVVLKACREYNIDPRTTKIKHLTVDELTEMQNRSYDQSNYPKD